jgi:AcrR family transcriptional regulator
MNDKISAAAKPASRSQRAREQALTTASSLFYKKGVRAVGMEEIVDTSGIAKTTIHRHFPTKDALIEAFLEKEDAEFWQQWDEAVENAATASAKLDALGDWIGSRVQRDAYRGCPQLNVAAEFADAAHPARAIARRHKAEMVRRLEAICAEAGADPADRAAMQVALLLDGAFMNDGRLGTIDAPSLLKAAIHRLVATN